MLFLAVNSMNHATNESEVQECFANAHEKFQDFIKVMSNSLIADVE